MSKTWHQYDMPIDTSVHLGELHEELREKAITTTNETLVTCPGCRDWIDRTRRAKERN